MSESHTEFRTVLSVDGEVYALTGVNNIDNLVSRVEEAAQDGGRFVEFSMLGGQTVRTLITSTSRVAISTTPVLPDRYDATVEDSPFGSHFDDYS